MTAPSPTPTPAPVEAVERTPRVDVVRPADSLGVEAFGYRGQCTPPAPQLANAYVVALVDRGGGIVRYRGRDYPVGPGALLLSKPDELSSWMSVADAPLELRALHIDAAGFERQLASVRDARAVEFRRFVASGDALAARAEAVFEAAFGAPRPIRVSEALAALIDALGADWVADCGRAGENAGPVCPGFVRRARRHLRDHSRSRVTLAELERVTGRGRFEIIRGFKHAIGTTPHEFLVHTRVQHARRLLRDGHRPVDVAGWVGFFDQSHLNRHFKRLLGVTPARYRDARR